MAVEERLGHSRVQGLLHLHVNVIGFERRALVERELGDRVIVIRERLHFRDLRRGEI